MLKLEKFGWREPTISTAPSRTTTWVIRFSSTLSCA